MIIDIVTCLCIIVLAIKVIVQEVKLHKLESVVAGEIYRNRIQHRRYESDITTLSNMHTKLHLNSIYGKLAYADTDSIKVEKEGCK